LVPNTQRWIYTKLTSNHGWRFQVDL